MERGERELKSAVCWESMTFDIPCELQLKVRFPPFFWLLGCIFEKNVRTGTMEMGLKEASAFVFGF